MELPVVVMAAILRRTSGLPQLLLEPACTGDWPVTREARQPGGGLRGTRSAGRRRGEGRGLFHLGSGGDRAGRAGGRGPEAGRAQGRPEPFVRRRWRRGRYGGRQLVGGGQRFRWSPLGRSFRWSPLLRWWRPLVLRRRVVLRGRFVVRWRRRRLRRLQLIPAVIQAVVRAVVRAALHAVPRAVLRAGRPVPSRPDSPARPSGQPPAGAPLFDRTAPHSTAAPAPSALAPAVVTHLSVRPLGCSQPGRRPHSVPHGSPHGSSRTPSPPVC